MLKSLARLKKLLLPVALLSFLAIGKVDICLGYTQENCLTLEDYLFQVSQSHYGFKGAKKIAKGAKLREVEGHLITRPALYGQAEYIRNSYNPTFSPIQGNETSLQNYKLGLSQVTPYGLEGKVYYNYQHQTYSGTSPLFVTDTQFYTSSPVVEFDLSLWRNFAGRETRATIALLESQAKLSHYTAKFKMTSLLADAEKTYWRMALAKQMLAIQLESLERARRIKEWTCKRTSLRLADNADLLQAQAGIDLRLMDLQTARDELKLAAHAFNTMRGLPEDDVPEQLACFNDACLENIKIPIRHGFRDDIQAARQQTRIAIANARLGIEKNKPDLNLYAAYSFNGRNANPNDAVSQSFSTAYPSSTIGVRLRLPLDYGSLSRVQAGYCKEIRGAEYQYRQQVFEQNQFWNELVLRLETAKKRLCIARRLEDIQLRKLDAEKQRHTLGRTTTYQVLLFEQDYANAQVSRLMIQAEILGYVTQLKTFGACL